MTAPAAVPTPAASTTPPTAAPTTPSTAPAPRRAAPAARVWSLARAEILLLLRNRTTLFNALAIAPATVGFLAWIGAGSVPGAGGADGEQATATFLLTSLAAVALVFVVYYNLTTTLVARREELVLKRLLTGQVSATEIVVACATPAVVIVLGQLALGAVAVAAWFTLPDVAHPLWPVLAVVGGVVVFVLLAVASSGLTRTVESAQLTTLPVIMLTMVLSGFSVPLDALPGAVATAASWTPMHPVVALIRAGFGTAPADAGAFAAVGQPVLCLALWTVVGLWAARRWMRWEPRR